MTNCWYILLLYFTFYVAIYLISSIHSVLFFPLFASVSGRWLVISFFFKWFKFQLKNVLRFLVFSCINRITDSERGVLFLYFYIV